MNKEKQKEFEKRVKCGVAFCEDTQINEIKQDFKMHKEKQKQIEEMATIMCGNDCEECARESAEFYRQTIEEARNNICLLKNCAKELYNAGYRKINENEVVISKEKYEQLQESVVDLKLDKFELKQEISEKDNKIKLLEETIQCIKFNVDFTRKETAEKIYTFVNSFGTHNWERFKEFIKQLGVDLGE